MNWIPLEDGSSGRRGDSKSRSNRSQVLSPTEDAATENVEVVLGVWKGRGESSKAGARRGKDKVGAGEGEGRCG